MWQQRTEHLAHGDGQRIILLHDGELVPYAEVIGLWQTDPEFRAYFIGLLTALPYRAFRWETPPVGKRTMARPFEHVVIDDPGLDCAPDPRAFARQFADRTEASPVLAFPNLGHDATFMVPRPLGPEAMYVHFAAFLRGAPRSQIDALWLRIGQEMQTRSSQPGPIWLNTAGGGVAWLHVRLDSRPKYYRYAPYRDGG